MKFTLPLLKIKTSTPMESSNYIIGKIVLQLNLILMNFFRFIKCSLSRGFFQCYEWVCSQKNFSLYPNYFGRQMFQIFHFQKILSLAIKNKNAYFLWFSSRILFTFILVSLQQSTFKSTLLCFAIHSSLKIGVPSSELK